MTALFRKAVAALFVLGVLALGATDAHATHFRYGTLRWEVLGDNGVFVTVRITHESAWRRSYPWPGGQVPTIGIPLTVGMPLIVQKISDGTQLFNQPMTVIPSSINTTEDWFVGANQVETAILKTDLPVRIFWDSNARVSTLADNNNDQPFRVESVMSATPNAASPAASILPIVTVAHGLPAAKFFIPAADVEGDTLTWSVSPTGRSRLVTPVPNGASNAGPTLSINPATGEVTWNTAAENPPGCFRCEFFAVQFLVTDSKGGETPVDALLRLVPNQGVAPEALINGTTAPYLVSVRPGNPVSFTLAGVDADPGATVMLTSGALPPGATMTPSLPTGGPGNAPGTSSVFDWTPTLAQAGNVFVVSFAVTDNFGLQDTNSAQITVLENFAPSATCPAPITEEATGPTGADATVDVNVSDPDQDPLTVRWFVDGILVHTENVPAGPGATVSLTRLYALGPHGVRVEVDDGQLTRECTTTVTVVDTTPPVVTVPADITEEAEGPAGNEVDFTATAFDIVDGNITPTCAPPSGSTFPLGSTVVTCTATDNAGNTGSASFSVHIVDTTAPVVTVPPDMTVEATGPSGATVTFTATAHDLVDGPLVPTCTPPSGGTFPLGTTNVVCTATDSHGNTGSADFDITVQDTTPPVVTVPADMTVEATGPSGATVSFTATAEDLVDGAITPTCTPASGGTFPLGTTNVVCTATDNAGNTGSADFDITVQDTTPPVISNMPANMLLEATGPAGAVATWPSPTAFDLVDLVVPVTCAPASGSTFPLDVTTTVTCSASDTRGNTSSETFTVRVQDTTPPVISNLPGNIVVPATGPGGAIVSWPPPTAVDLVDGVVPVTCVPPSGSLFPIGTTTVTCSASDTRGNTSTANFTVTVAGDTKPPKVCLELTPAKLWPPNHKMKTIQVRIVVTDNNDPTPFCEITSVTSSEPVTGPRYGNTTPDWIFSGTDLQLRAERYDRAGRTYTVTASCTDDAGNVGTATTTVRVPHDLGHGGGGHDDDDGGEADKGGEHHDTSRSCCRRIDPHHDDDDDDGSGLSGDPQTSGGGSGPGPHHDPPCPIYDDTPPVIKNMPGDKVREATGPSGAEVSWPSPTAHDDIDGNVPVVCIPASGSMFPLDVTTTVTCTARDSWGNTASETFTVRVQDTTPPAIDNMPANMTVPSGPGGAVVTWPPPTAEDLVDGSVPVTCLPPSGSTFPVGATTVRCSASDSRGNSSERTFRVTVLGPDNKPPKVCLRLKPATLWPANHALRSIQVNVTASDNQDPNPDCAVTAVTSSEPVIGPRYGNTSPDWTFGNLALALRAERYDRSGRTYNVTVSCADESGNVGTASASVRVPWTQGHHLVDESESTSSGCCSRGNDLNGGGGGPGFPCHGDDDDDDGAGVTPRAGN
jgi:hypothetical protein